jgi:hypothetical protein
MINRKAQYEKHLTSWGFLKKIPRSIWEVVARKIAKRKRDDGKDSVVSVGGQLVPVKRLKRGIQRYGSGSRNDSAPYELGKVNAFSIIC